MAYHALYRCTVNKPYSVQKWEQVCASGRAWPEARVGHSAVSLNDPDSSPEEPQLLILWGQDDKTPVSTLGDGWVLKICKNGNLEWTEVYMLPLNSI